MRVFEEHEIAIVSGSESGAGYANPGTYTLDPGKYGDNDLAETVVGFLNGFAKGFTSGL
jgi:hypothetical protein